jgi:glycerophosphoryl diester phosphodiesterase
MGDVKTLTVALALLLFGVTVPAQADTPDPVNIGHRGGRPENTLTGFRVGVAGGAKVLETDVQWSKDGRMFLLHDDTLTRTTNCTGTVITKTAATLRRCLTDADHQPLPYFDDLLDYARAAGVGVDAELKLPGLTVAQAQTYVDHIAARGMKGQVTATSFYTSNLNRVRSAVGDEGIARGIIDYDRPHTAAEAAERGTVIAANLDHTDADRVKAAHAAGVRVWVWTVTTDAGYAKAKAIGADGIITNDPAGLTGWEATH